MKLEGTEPHMLQLSLRHHGLDPFSLYHYGDVDDEGNPVQVRYPSRYKNFLLACSIVTQEQVNKESAMAFGGTSKEEDNSAAKPKGRKKR